MPETRFASPLGPELARAGAVPSAHGPPPRHFGDPSGEYARAVESAAVADLSHRTRLMVAGRAPRQMLGGVLTGRMPEPPAPGGDGWAGGGGGYSAVLTPRGRMISDLRVFAPTTRPGAGAGDLLLDVPAAGAPALLEHFGRSIPPRFARVFDVSDRTALIAVVGPSAGSRLAPVLESLTPGGGVPDGTDLDGLAPLECRALPAAHLRGADGPSVTDGDAGPDWTDLVVFASDELSVPALYLLGPLEPVRTAWSLLLEAGAGPVGHGVWETLRVEAGTPAFGRDMTDETLPPEAGIQDRAIDHDKGCYTGQEVIVRIRDRGHVNRRLRGLLLGDVPTPPAGTALLDSETGQARGILTSAVLSPRWGGVIGLGYVRREVEPPARLVLDTPEGETVEVRTLAGDTWAPDGETS